MYTYPIVKVPDVLGLLKPFHRLRNHPSCSSDDETKKGLMEPAFSIILNRNFKNMIFQDKMLDAYCPDFIYFNKKINLYIDIEIDEPYKLSTKEPIHFTGSDELRDSFFLSKGWCVIRFSEKQVVRQYQECCNEIKKLVNSIYRNSHRFSNNKLYLEKEPVWTKEVAIRMSKEDFRYSYLSQKNNLLMINLLKDVK